MEESTIVQFDAKGNLVRKQGKMSEERAKSVFDDIDPEKFTKDQRSGGWRGEPGRHADAAKKGHARPGVGFRKDDRTLLARIRKQKKTL